MLPRILIVEDAQRAEGVARWLLNNRLEASVVVETADLKDAPRLARKVRPHLMLIETAMLSGHALRAIRRIKAERPGMSMILLSTNHKEAGQKAEGEN